MIELAAENALDYLCRHQQMDVANARAELLTGGVSNQVLRITCPDRVFILKQSRPQLRTRDAWFSDMERIHREQEVMQALHPLLPHFIPEILFVDRPNFIYAMSHAPEDAVVWKTALLHGEVDCHLGTIAGELLGRIHQFSAERRDLFKAFSDIRVFTQLRIDPFYRCIQRRCPEVAMPLEAIIQDMLTRKQALCHGDYTPKNMLVQSRSFTLVDYETAHDGDPAMDLGLFLAHLQIKAVHATERREAFVALMRSFWIAYGQEIHMLSLPDLERRGLLHFGACLLARVDGTSPVEYLREESQRMLIRQLGKMILLEQIVSWEEAWHRCEQVMQQAF